MSQSQSGTVLAGDSRPRHAITTARTVDGWHLAVEPTGGDFWFHRAAAGGGIESKHWSVGNLPPAGPATRSSDFDADPTTAEDLPPLPPESICRRYTMEMREAPLPPGLPAEPAWSGAAIVLGSNPTAEALVARLQRSGVVVYALTADGDVDVLVGHIQQIAAAGPAPHLFLTTGRDGLPLDFEHPENWPHQRQAMALPLLACQQWMRAAAEHKWLDCCTLVATTAEEGDFGFARGSEFALGEALAGLLKAIFVEFNIMAGEQLNIKVIDAPAAEPADSLADNIVAELASGSIDYEVAFVDGRRLLPFPIDRPAVARRSGIRRGGRWVVTGGARGITALCALHLARRYGLKLHLIGSSPLRPIDPAWRNLTDAGRQQLKASSMIAARKEGRNAAQVWQRVQKDIEIDAALRAFDAAQVAYVYHACDVADRAALANTLETIRHSDGPIEGILHGAGIERSCRFDRKQRDVVLQTIDIKVGGAANLMALTRRDPIRHFVGFGSVSGRIGGFGQADYCVANEMLAKLVGAYRRRRPWIREVTFHWHAWAEVGMAARPELKEILEGKSNLTFMPPGEGVAHLLRELAAAAPQPEVVITESRHMQRPTGSLGELQASPAPPPLVQNIRPAGQGMVADVPLDPTRDPFLVQHRLRNKPLLPVVVGLEALAEVAAAAGGRPAVAFQAIDMVDGLLFHSDRAMVAQARAMPRPDGRFDCELTCDFLNRAGELMKKDRPYLRAVVELAQGAMSLPAPLPARPELSTGIHIQYPDHALVYHGPPFRGVTVCYPLAEGHSGWSKIMALPLGDLTGAGRTAGWRIPSVVLDSAMYACGLHLWAAGGNLLGLPRGFGRLEIGRAPRDGETCWLHFVCRTLATERPAYDFQLVGDDGALILRADDYYKVVFGQGDAL